jgi:hypothetical protein
MEYPNLPQIDFFVIDEFYKLSAKRDDERSDVLNNAFYKLLPITLSAVSRNKFPFSSNDCCEVLTIIL